MLLKQLKKIFKKRLKEYTFIFCSCGNEMTSDSSFVGDDHDENGNDYVKFKCEQCGKESNVALAPIDLEN